jgi:hypothetical protein
MDNIQRLVSPPGTAPDWVPADKQTWSSYLGRPSTDPARYDINFHEKSGTESGSFCYLGGPGRFGFLTWDEWDDISGGQWVDDHGQTQWRGPTFDALGSVCVTARTANLTDLFIIGRDGRVWCCWQTTDGDWSGFNERKEWSRLYFGDDETPKFDPKAKLAVAARRPDNLDVFAVALDGKVYTISWALGKPWSGWTDIPDAVFPSGAPIAAVSRHDKQLDLFVNAGAGGIYTSSWTEDATQPAEWTGWTTLNPGSARFPGSAEILVLGRSKETLDVFVTGRDGHVYTAAWLEGSGWWPFGDVGTGRNTKLAPGGRVAGLAGTDRMDLFAVSLDHRLHTCSWVLGVGWSGVGDDANGHAKHWQSLGYGTNEDGTVRIFNAATADVAAVRRTHALGSDMDVFVTGTGGQVYRTHWSAVLNTWSTGNGDSGWDEHVGGERDIVHDRGFRIGVTSRNPASLTVVSITTAGRAEATEYDGITGLL